MHVGKPLLVTFTLMLLVGIGGCSSLGGGGLFASETSANVGSAQWWKANKSKATFVPGKGYQVAGVPGYFDDFGRPMDGGAEPASTGNPDAPVLASYEDALEPKVEEGLLGGLDPEYSFHKLKRKLGPERNADLAQKCYDEGERLFKEKKYTAAAKKFKEAAQRWEHSPLEERALFMEAESYFFADRYPKANDGYNALIKKYVNTQFLDKAITRQFAIARFWEQHHRAEPRWPTTPNLFDKSRHMFDTKGHALKVYENIRLNDPTGPLADDALFATANSHFLSGRYRDADYYYGELRKEYPESEFQYQAHLLGLQCKLLCYQGPDYDQTPLAEARQLTEQLLTQFSNELGDERKRILETRQQVVAALAIRDWKMAQFYEGKSEYGSARFYYEQLVRDYPTTKLAEEAQNRLAAIGDKPAIPPNYFEWLEEALPSNKGTVISAQPVDEVRR